MSELTQIVNNPEETQINSQTNLETQITENLNKFVLKKGFYFMPEQRKKILKMPLQGFVAKMNNLTNQMEMPIGDLSINKQELTDYLIPFFFEKSNGSQITEQDFCEMEFLEYEEMAKKVKQIDPFGVYKITAF